MTKLSAAAPCWSPSKLSANAPCWSPAEVRSGNGSAAPSPNLAINTTKPSSTPVTASATEGGKEKAPIPGGGTPTNTATTTTNAAAAATTTNAAAKAQREAQLQAALSQKKFSFSGKAKPFTPPSVAAASSTTTSALPQAAAVEPSPVSSFPSAPVPAFPDSPGSGNPIPSPATSVGRTSKLTASAAPFTPKSFQQQQPLQRSNTGSSTDLSLLDPSAKEFVPKQPAASPELTGKKHPLYTPWTLWYRSGQPDPTSPGAPASEDTWADALKTIYNIKDVETYWGVFDQIRSPSSLHRGATYYLFRTGVKPAWEDPECTKGGDWKLWLPSPTPSRKNEVDAIWILLTLQCIGEQFALSEDVCGVAVETRAKADRVSLWTRTTDKSRTMALGRELKRLLQGFFPTDQPMCFTSHSKSLSGRDKDADYFLID